MTGRGKLVVGPVALGLAALGVALLWPEASSGDGWRGALDGAVQVVAVGCGPHELRGSGAVVAEERVATVAHLVAGARELEVRDRGGSLHRAEVLALDPDRDLALLEVTGLRERALASGDMETGEEGWVLRYTSSGLAPRRFRLLRRVRARVADIYRERTVGRDALEVRAEIDPGDSGAALVDQEGKLVGIAFASSEPRDRIAYAVASSELERLLLQAEPAPAERGRCP